MGNFAIGGIAFASLLAMSSTSVTWSQTSAPQAVASPMKMMTDAGQPKSAIFVPFSPPIGSEIRYHVIKYRGDGETIGSTFDCKVKFERAEGGKYLLSVTWPFVPDPAGSVLFSVDYDVDSDGKVLGLHDWETAKADLRRVLERAAAAGADDAKRRQMLKAVSEITSAPATVAAFNLIDWLHPVLGYGGRQWIASAPNKSGTFMRGGLMAVPLPGYAVLSVSRLSPSQIKLSSETTLDRERAPRVALSALAELVRSRELSAADEARIKPTAVRAASMPTVDHLEAFLDQFTGLPIQARAERDMIMEGVGKVRIVTTLEQIK